MPCPSHARSVVLSPGPAAEYTYALNVRIDWAAHSSMRSRALPMTMLDADRLARMSAPAMAPVVDGGVGAQMSSHTSAQKSKPSWSVAANRRSRSEEHTSELQSLMRISYAVFCLNTK